MGCGGEGKRPLHPTPHEAVIQEWPCAGVDQSRIAGTERVALLVDPAVLRPPGPCRHLHRLVGSVRVVHLSPYAR